MAQIDLGHTERAALDLRQERIHRDRHRADVFGQQVGFERRNGTVHGVIVRFAGSGMLRLHWYVFVHQRPRLARVDPRPYDAGITMSWRGEVMIDGFLALYIFMLAAFTGYEIIARVPVILHTPLMSGSNFIHGIVLVGAMIALGHASSTLEVAIGFIGVLLGAGNAAGGYVVTERMLEMFKSSKPLAGKEAK
jgi:NAD(P) transhydrogenase subunit alpha